MRIISRFNSYSGIVETGGGYTETARVDKDRLIEVLERLPAGNIILTTAPHSGGQAVLVRHASVNDLTWHVLAPTIQDEKVKSDEINLKPGSLGSLKDRRKK
jgi:hypothetical protein